MARYFRPIFVSLFAVTISTGVFLFAGNALALGEAQIDPNTSNTDNLIGATNASWKFSVTSTQDLERGDVIQFWFPNMINMIPEGDQFSVANASVVATSGISLYSALGTGPSNLIANSDFENWTENVPDNWTPSGWMGAPITAATTSVTTTKYHGTDSLQVETGADSGLGLTATVSNLTTSSPYTVSIYLNNVSATGSVLLYLSSYNNEGGDAYWNFITQQWVAALDLVQFQTFYTCSTTVAEWSRCFATMSTVASSTLNINFAIQGSNATMLFDAAQLVAGEAAGTYVVTSPEDTYGIANGGQSVVYAYIGTTTASNTPFSVTVGGITNPSGRRSLLQNLSWTVKAGTPNNGSPGFSDTLQTTKLNVSSVTTTITRAGGSLVVDENTGVFLSTYTTSTAANYTFRFTPTSSIPVGGKIMIEFPASYASLLNDATVSTTEQISLAGTTTSTIGGFTTSTSGDGGRRFYLTVSSTAVAAGDPLTVTIYSVTNPSTGGVYGADSSGPGNRFIQFTTKSNSGLLDGSVDPYSDGDFGEGMGPPPPSSVIIGGKHTINILVQMNTATTTRNLTAEERDYLQVGMGNPDKGYFIGMRRLGSNSAAQYAGLLDGTYRVGAEMTNKTNADTYSSLLAPGERTISLLGATATTITTTLYFGQPDTTTTVTLTGGVSGQYAFILATSPNYQSYAPVYTDSTYTTQGFSATGTGFARVKVKSGDTWSFSVMGGQSYGQNTNFSSGTVKYWPPAISSSYIAASGTIDLGSYAYVEADKTLNVSLKYAGTENYVGNACVGVKRTGGGMFMGSQDEVCNPAQDGGSNSDVYEFKVPLGSIAVTVGRPGMGQPEEYPVAITSSTNNRTIYLTGASNYISVSVVDSAGNAIRNASIFAKSTNGGFGQGMTGTNGTTTLYVPLGTYSVDGFAPGMGPLGSQSATVSAGSNPSVTFTINTGNLRTVSGQVTVGGSGLAGVKIGARGTGNTNGGNGTETDSSGNYTLYLPSGTYEVGGWSPDTGGLSPQAVDVSSGNVTGKNWTFTGGFGTVRITIDNSSNLSQLFAGVFSTSSGRGNGTDSWTASGTSKYADIRVPAGTYVVNAGSPITGPIIEEETVVVTESGTANVTGDAQASVSLVAISGTVTLDSVGVKDINVWASRLGTPRFFSVLTNSSGVYTLYVPANGTYRVGIKTPSYIASEGDINVAVTTGNSSGNDFTLTSAAATITGQVTSGGSAVSNGWVSAKKSAGEIWTGAPTDGNGNYTLNVDSGSWTVYAEGPGYERSSGTATTAGSTGVNISLTALSGWVAPTPMMQGITDTSGGQMSMSNSTLNLPANALGTNSSVITVTMVTTTPRNAPNATALKNSVVSIAAQNSSGQSVSSLNSNATLSLTLDTDDLTELKIAESSLQFAYFDETSGQWEPMAATIDTTNHMVTVQTDHFTDFAPVVGGPDAPTDLTASAATPGQIDLSWSAPIATTTYYAVYATTSAISAFPTSTLIATTTVASYNHTILTTGATWYYKVAGVNDIGEGPNSDRANATVTALSTPTGLSASAASVSAINLSWTAVSGAASYKVYRDTDSYATAIGAPSTNSYSDSGLSAATTYSYKVSAVNGNGEGEKSSVASATTNSNNTGGGGAASSEVVPTMGSTPVSISGGNTVTSRNITLNFSVTNADYVAISEHQNFTGAAWETYAATKQFTLSEGSGAKKIYVKFRSATGGVAAMQTITANYSAPASEEKSVADSVAVNKTQSSLMEVIAPVNPQSGVVITAPVVIAYNPGQTLGFAYKYANTGSKKITIKIVRQLLNAKGKAVASVAAFKTVKAGAVFSASIKEKLSAKLAVGTYTERIRVYDGNNKLLDENSFQIKVEKPKSKYFILGADVPASGDIAFDIKTYNQAKAVRTRLLPSTVKFKYSYTNSTAEHHYVNMVRELIGPDDVVAESKTGKWTMKPGEKDSLTFTQTLKKTLTPGTYMIRIRAYDRSTKELLAENSIGFTIEER